MDSVEVKVPDIGDFTDVDVIEVMVKPGDKVGIDDPLIAIESEKATMEVPAPQGGVIKDIKVKLGDKVSEGSLILTIEADEAAPDADPNAPPGADIKASPTPNGSPVGDTKASSEQGSKSPSASTLHLVTS